MFEILTKYYGLDLIAMGITSLGIYLIGNKKQSGFLLAIIGGMIWIVFAILTQTIGLIIANIILIMLNLRGYLKWKK